jgi:hypothetical protein
MHAAELIDRHGRFLHARAVVRDEGMQIEILVPPMLGNQPRDRQPAATRSLPARHFEHRHALVGHVAQRDLTPY